MNRLKKLLGKKELLEKYFYGYNGFYKTQNSLSQSF